MGTVKKLSWYTPPVGVEVGYGYAAVETINALARNNVHVSWCDFALPAHINFIQPDIYRGDPWQYKIGYTPWESTEVEEMWPTYMRKMNEIWTTSNFCKEVFEAHNCHDIIRIVPHGIDPEIFSIHDRTLNDKFIFFHIGGPIGRKGGKMVADAFVELFDGRDDVHLLMKSHGSSEARWITKEGEYIGNISRHPQVTVIEERLTADELAILYHKSHCLVYPTNGEGFGLIPFQGLATGIPTITTNLTGTADFAHYSMPLDAKWGPGDGVHIGDWAIPDPDHLRELMLYVVDNWEDEKKKTMQAARILHNTQTWDHVALQIIDILKDHLEVEDDS